MRNSMDWCTRVLIVSSRMDPTMSSRKGKMPCIEISKAKKALQIAMNPVIIDTFTYIASVS